MTAICSKCNEELLTIWSFCPMCGQSKFSSAGTVTTSQPIIPVKTEAPKVVPKPAITTPASTNQEAQPIAPQKEVYVDRTVQIVAGSNPLGIKCGNCGSTALSLTGGPTYMCTKCKYFGQLEQG